MSNMVARTLAALGEVVEEAADELEAEERVALEYKLASIQDPRSPRLPTRRKVAKQLRNIKISR